MHCGSPDLSVHTIQAAVVIDVLFLTQKIPANTNVLESL